MYVLPLQLQLHCTLLTTTIAGQQDAHTAEGTKPTHDKPSDVICDQPPSSTLPSGESNSNNRGNITHLGEEQRRDSEQLSVNSGERESDDVSIQSKDQDGDSTHQPHRQGEYNTQKSQADPLLKDVIPSTAIVRSFRSYNQGSRSSLFHSTQSNLKSTSNQGHTL